MKLYYFSTLKALWDDQGKVVGVIMGCPEWKWSYREKGLFCFTWLYVRSFYNSFPQKSGGFEVASTRIPSLQIKRVRKRSPYPCYLYSYQIIETNFDNFSALYFV